MEIPLFKSMAFDGGKLMVDLVRDEESEVIRLIIFDNGSITYASEFRGRAYVHPPTIPLHVSSILKTCVSR